MGRHLSVTGEALVLGTVQKRARWNCDRDIEKVLKRGKDLSKCDRVLQASVYQDSLCCIQW